MVARSISTASIGKKVNHVAVHKVRCAPAVEDLESASNILGFGGEKPPLLVAEGVIEKGDATLRR